MIMWKLFSLVGWLLEAYILAPSKSHQDGHYLVIVHTHGTSTSGWELTYDMAHSWCLYSAAPLEDQASAL